MKKERQTNTIMNFILDKNKFSVDNIHFSEIKHNIIIYGNFTKIFYSTPYFVLNNIFIDFEIIPTEFRQYTTTTKSVNKYIVYFDLCNENVEILQKIIDIEKYILDYYFIYRNICKTPEYILKNQIMNKNFKFYKETRNLSSSNEKFYLKISGVWENNQKFGITYKIMN